MAKDKSDAWSKPVGCLVFLVLAGVVVYVFTSGGGSGLTVTSSKQQEQQTAQSEKPLPNYEILDKEILQGGAKDQVVWYVACPEVSAENGERLVRTLADRAVADVPFEPSHIFIYVYPSPEYHALSGAYWRVMLDKTGADQPRRVKVQDEDTWKYIQEEVKR